MAGTRILVVWPPNVPSYFNAGHHLCVFMVGAHLRRCADVSLVRAIDAGALNGTWKDLGDLLFEGYDVIAVANDHDAVDGLGRLIDYARALSPGSSIVTFGRLSQEVPGFFRRYDLDGIVESGDYEAGVGAFVDWVRAGGAGTLPGVAVRAADGWQAPSGPGRWLDVATWPLPDIREIPYEAYDRLYVRDANKFCGIPERRELVVPVARGCPVRCAFCDVPQREGIRERRLPVEVVMRYVEESFAAAPFEYVAMYAPTFTLKPTWVRHLCQELIARGARYPWKCTTTLYHLSQDLVEVMGASGCVRISVGLETLDPGGWNALPPLKRTYEERFDAVAAWCRASGIELNCFVILGLPGTSVAGAQHTVQKVRAAGARVRPTIYTPFNELRADMDEATVARFNRQLLADDVLAEEAATLYALYFGHEPRPTRVTEGIRPDPRLLGQRA